MHRLFKRFKRRAGASLLFKDLSCAMRRFIQKNRYDPTIITLGRDVPSLAQVSNNVNVVALIQQEVAHNTGSLVWTDLAEYDDAVIQELKERGTPAIFDSCMSSDNWIRTSICRNSENFVFGLVNYMNANGLLAHIMALEDGNKFGFPVTEARKYLSRLSTSSIFLNEPCKLKVIVEVVGVGPVILQSLLEEAAAQMMMSSTKYLLRAGASL